MPIDIGPEYHSVYQLSQPSTSPHSPTFVQEKSLTRKQTTTWSGLTLIYWGERERAPIPSDVNVDFSVCHGPAYVQHGDGACVSFFARGSVCYHGYSLSSEHR